MKTIDSAAFDRTLKFVKTFGDYNEEFVLNSIMSAMNTPPEEQKTFETIILALYEYWYRVMTKNVSV